MKELFFLFLTIFTYFFNPGLLYSQEPIVHLKVDKDIVRKGEKFFAQVLLQFPQKEEAFSIAQLTPPSSQGLVLISSSQKNESIQKDSVIYKQFAFFYQFQVLDQGEILIQPFSAELTDSFGDMRLVQSDEVIINSVSFFKRYQKRITCFVGFVLFFFLFISFFKRFKKNKKIEALKREKRKQHEELAVYEAELKEKLTSLKIKILEDKVDEYLFEMKGLLINYLSIRYGVSVSKESYQVDLSLKAGAKVWIDFLISLDEMIESVSYAGLKVDRLTMESFNRKLEKFINTTN